jgi:phage terminase large subunit-like protein
VKAENIRLFFQHCLSHVQGIRAGEPFTLSEWQYHDIILPLFGTLGTDGLRRFRTAYIEIPRKNGKSTLAAGIALALLFADGEQGAEIVSAAADREQASIVFDLASRMVQGNPVLSSRCQVLRKEIITRKGNRYRALSADAYTKHGLNCSGIIFDELHAQPNRELWDVLTTSVAARAQPLTMAITTAGHDRSSLCYEMHMYARGVKDGSIIDPTFLPVLYGAGDGADWKSPETWRSANPGYGISVRPEYLEQAAAEAAMSPARELAFRRLHLNQWTDTVTRWLAPDAWDRCQSQRPELAGRVCYGALDLSSSMDLSAFVLAFPLDDGTIWLEPFCWAPRGALKNRERTNRQRFDQWASAGFLTVTDGDVIEYEAVYEKIKSLAQQYRIIDIAIDRWNCAQLAQQMMTDGLSVVAFGQGYASMSPAAKDFEALMISEKLRHSGHPVLRWCSGNCSIEADAAGNIKPSKGRSSEKIDLLVASIMAVARARVGEAGGAQKTVPSIYESRGLALI